MDLSGVSRLQSEPAVQITIVRQQRQLKIPYFNYTRRTFSNLIFQRQRTTSSTCGGLFATPRESRHITWMLPLSVSGHAGVAFVRRKIWILDNYGVQRRVGSRWPDFKKFSTRSPNSRAQGRFKTDLVHSAPLKHLWMVDPRSRLGVVLRRRDRYIRSQGSFEPNWATTHQEVWRSRGLVPP